MIKWRVKRPRFFIVIFNIVYKKIIIIASRLLRGWLWQQEWFRPPNIPRYLLVLDWIGSNWVWLGLDQIQWGLFTRWIEWIGLFTNAKCLKIEIKIKAMFVSRNSLFGKPLSKLSCVCLPLGKLVNGEHFPVNGEHFPVNEKHFRVKEKFGLVSRKVFSLWLCLFSGKWFPGNHFPNFLVFVCH